MSINKEKMTTLMSVIQNDSLDEMIRKISF